MSRTPARPLASLLVAAALGGCGAAEQAVSGAADAAGDEVRRAVGDVAEGAVRDQVCQVVGDGRVSEAELVALRAALAAAEGAGLPAPIVGAARDVVGDSGSREAVGRLEEACGAR